MPGMLSKCSVLLRPSPLIRAHPARLMAALPLCGRRAVHTAKADFITMGPSGSPSTRKLDVLIGDANDAFVYFEKEVGLAFESAIAEKVGLPASVDKDMLPLIYYHDSRHFAHKALPYPRVVIQQNLPRQNAGNTSPATLWLWGATNSITLDGTPDAGFEKLSRESHYGLKGAIELLKDV